jgi:hypothetical protein
MDSTTLVMDLIAGGMLGLLGQGIRVAIGLRKMQAARAEGSGEPFDPRRLALSLALGFVAGSLATLGLRAADGLPLDERTIGGLLAAGYAGADFVEGFIRQHTPGDAAVAPATGRTA